MYVFILPDTIDTYEADLGDLVTKLIPGFVSCGGTAPGVKQLIFPGVDISPYSV